MSNEETVNFPTTATQQTEPEGPSPEQLKKIAKEGIPQILRLVNQNRKEGIVSLQRRLDSIEGALDQLKKWTRDNNAPLMVLKDSQDNQVFSLGNELINVKAALDATLTATEAQDSLLDMLVNDIIGLVNQIGQLQKAIMISNGQCQTLIQLLIDKELVTENEMKNTWHKIMQQSSEQFKSD